MHPGGTCGARSLPTRRLGCKVDSVVARVRRVDAAPGKPRFPLKGDEDTSDSPTTYGTPTSAPTGSVAAADPRPRAASNHCGAPKEENYDAQTEFPFQADRLPPSLAPRLPEQEERHCVHRGACMLGSVRAFCACDAKRTFNVEREYFG
jgi:hypothetical protein